MLQAPSLVGLIVLVGTFKKEKVLVASRGLLRARLTSRRFVVRSTLEGLVSESGVTLGLQQVVAEVHDHEPGEGVEQSAAHHAQLVVVEP